MLYAVILNIVLFFILRTLYLIRFQSKSKFKKKCARTLIVIGSGGHTSEMTRHIKNIDSTLYQPRLYIMADTDTSSEVKIHEAEADFKTDYFIEKIPRSRHAVMALKGVKVVELAGLAPGPLCGMILADFGATVIRVDKVRGISDLDCLKNGKKSLALNLKDPKGIEILKRLTAKSDVLIEPFRKGVMEQLGVGPQTLQEINPKLIYARLTGFGQSGSYSKMAGHDINYVATSGVLSFLGRKNEKPTFPVNLLADFGGGGLTCALGIILALFERTKSGKGQIIDCSMVEGTAYLSSWLFRSQQLPIWGNERGCNVLDTGSHFYDTYETKDGKYMAVGALEGQFYEILIEKLEVDIPDQWSDFDGKKKIVENAFKTKTRDEWCEIFDGTDACVTPVLEAEEAPDHPHNKERDSFARLDSGIVAPKPAPKLSRTPGVSTAGLASCENGSDTEEILLELGYTKNEIERLNKDEVVKVVKRTSKL